MPTKSISIVVPVYADWDSLQQCLDSLKQFIDQRHKVMIVNDCGPDVNQLERQIKAAIKGQANFFYYRNPRNLGFVKTCNRAVLELDKTKNEILLLNSDTKVTAGFLEEMLWVLYADPKIGAVSPRSNNATIATVPLWAMKQKGIGQAKSYKLFLKLRQRLPRYNVAPTAHGFCMLIKRSLIDKYGLFDPVFGKGYGEEVDFCQRLKKHGFLSVLSNHAFVYHLEARSFSLETKAKLLAEHNQIIRARYPDYQQAVKDYVEQALRREEGTGVVGKLVRKIKHNFWPARHVR